MDTTREGSFIFDVMVVMPCSMNTLAKIASGISDSLITRAASVCLKERRRLILVPREMPLSEIALENMLRLTFSGVEVHSTGGNNSSGWQSYSMTSTTINIYDVTTTNPSFLKAYFLLI